MDIIMLHVTYQLATWHIKLTTSKNKTDDMSSTLLSFKKIKNAWAFSKWAKHLDWSHFFKILLFYMYFLKIIFGIYVFVTTWNFHVTFIFLIIMSKYNEVIVFYAIWLTIHPIIDSLVYQIYNRVSPITYIFS
jgi:hypothetical protein